MYADMATTFLRTHTSYVTIVKRSNAYSTGYATFTDPAKYVVGFIYLFIYLFKTCLILWHIAAGYVMLDF